MALKQEIAAIKARNARVESDKAWETSWTRRIALSVVTYVVVVSFFLVTGLDRPFINALVPTGAFLISTSTLSFIKRFWISARK